MRKVNYIYLILFTTLLFVGCSFDDVPEGDNSRIVELSYLISSFNIDGISTRATDVGSPAEQQIDNLYLLLFDMGGANPIKYFIDNTFAAVSGTWTKADGKINLKLTQSEAGNRQVYVVANVSAALKNTLDGVTSIVGLQAVKLTANTPWSPTLTTPILMSGNKTHNFVTNHILDNVPLTRAFAKVELNVTLPAKHQDADVSHYKYNFIDFDKKTYVLKPTVKTDDLVTTGWQPWQASSAVSSYTLAGGKVATLKVVTYINERDVAGSYIDIQLPYKAGPLPPPEFGNDTFKLPLPSEIKRNHWYKFDITL